MADDVLPDIPDYTPLNRYILREFESTIQVPVRDDGINDAIRSQLNGGLQDLFEYVECYFENDLEEVDTELIETYLKMATETLRAQFELKLFSNAVAEARAQLKADINDNPELRLETLEYFASIDKQGVFTTVKNTYTQAIQGKDQEFERFLKSNPHYEMYRNAAQIIMDPSMVIVQDNDDDIGISGGKISLTDAVSMKQFEDPRRLVKCGHTFDKDIVDRIFGKRGSDCPVAGCEYEMTRDDFVPDILMKLRVKVANEKDKQMKRQRLVLNRSRELTPV